MLCKRSTRPLVMLALVTLTLVAQRGECDDPAASEDAEARSKATQILKAMEDEFDERSKPFDELPREQGKERYELQARLLAELVRNRCKDDPEARDELIAAVLLLEDKEFVHAVSCELVSFLARDEYREEMVAFLAQRCPERIYIHVSVEALLISIADEELEDGTLVLCDAFEQSKDEEARKSIAAALRRGFKPLGVKGETDEDFVKQCRSWYIKYRERLEPDLDYHGQYIDPSFSNETTGVFRLRDDAKRNKKRTGAEVPQFED